MFSFHISQTNQIRGLSDFLRGKTGRLWDSTLSPTVAYICHCEGFEYIPGLPPNDAVIDSLTELPMLIWDEPSDKTKSLKKEWSIDEILYERDAIERWQIKPVLSIVTPFYNTKIEWAEACIESMRHQVYPHWEWCIVDDGSDIKELKQLLKELPKRDHRIKLKTHRKNKGPAAAYNSAVEMTSNSHVLFLDHDDELAPDATLEIAKVVAQDPTIDAIYSNNDRIVNDAYIWQTDKPDWSPLLILKDMYVCHIRSYSASLLKSRSFKSEFDGCQDYEWLVAMLPSIKNPVKIAKNLYHWRDVEGSASKKEGVHVAIEKLRVLRDVQTQYFLDIDAANQEKPI